jgi:DNA helicase HerA-like ATPase
MANAGATGAAGNRLLLGRDGGDGPTVHLGACLARDGTSGAPVDLDLDRPHAGLVVGKRGYGKSYTLGVLAEGLVDAPGVVPVVVDPMGAFAGLGALAGARVVERPRVSAGALPPRAWCDLLDLPPEGAAGGLLWRAATGADSLDGMREAVRAADADRAARRAALNHLDLADAWDAFDPDGLVPADLTAPTVLDCSGLAAAPTNAVVRGVVAGCYRARVEGRVDDLPWLLVDEAHLLFEGVAAPALSTLLTRGRTPGVSLVVATQRPAALPDVAVSQADLVVAHRLTAGADVEALERARPTYARSALADRLPERPGEAVVVDDATEAVHVVGVRDRRTPHGGDGARATGHE